LAGREVRETDTVYALAERLRAALRGPFLVMADG
jgi:hypothetical protein